MDPLHYYTTFIKFGIGRATYEASFEIRTSKIRRRNVSCKKYEDEFPSRYFSEILDYLNISEDFLKQSIMQDRHICGNLKITIGF